jgi:peptide-methionine (S)-S-oxide reductase
MKYVAFSVVLLIAGFIVSGLLMGSDKAQDKGSPKKQGTQHVKLDKNMELATFGNGCFWCTEAVFQELEGVEKVVSGYMGGHVKNPTYKQVCTGTTGHAEVLQIAYNPSKISFDELLEVFWATHDPTTLNRQGNDVGPQYRSIVFYHNHEQQQRAEKYKTDLNASGAFDKPIVTFIEPVDEFYPAEDYHQGYFERNGGEPYCRYVVQPKVDKFRKVFKDKLKPEYSQK